MTASTEDHQRVIAAIPAEERAALREKSDRHALVHLALHGGAIAALIWAVAVQVPGWPLLLPPLGILQIFLFTLLHECVHETPFRTPWLNHVVARITGFIVLVPCTWFTYFHLAHHRHTHDRDHDPELEGGELATRCAYAWHLTGLPTWKANIMSIWRSAFHPVTAAYVPERQRSRVKTEARLTLLAYALLAALSITVQSTLLLWIWVVPLLLGQPFLRAYLLAEHGRCPYVANMFENTRTTYTNRIVRFIAWNMPYHAEHHAYPNVPFWKLPRLHAIVRNHLRTTSEGYIRFNTEFASALSDSRRPTER